MEKQPEKELTISFIKTLMCLIIILYHSCIFFGGDWFKYVAPKYNANNIYWFARWLNTFHIHTFVMASGYIFYYLKDKYNHYNNPKTDIRKRWKRLIIPYFTTCLFWVIPVYFLFNPFSTKILIKKFVLCMSPNQLWFLIMLFGIFAIFELFSNKIRISRKNLIMAYFISTSLFVCFDFFGVNLFQIAKIAEFSLFFYQGGYLYKYKNNYDLRKKIIIILCCIGTLLIAISIRKYDTFIFGILYIFIIQLLSLLEVMIIYFICSYIVINRIVKNNSKMCSVLENNSFGIYLFHQQIIYFTIVLLNGVVHPIVQVLLSFIISLTLSLLMSVILKKNKITKFMFGL